MEAQQDSRLEAALEKAIRGDQAGFAEIVEVHQVVTPGALEEFAEVAEGCQFEARVSKQNDSYVLTVSPERLWTLLFGKEEE